MTVTIKMGETVPAMRRGTVEKMGKVETIKIVGMVIMETVKIIIIMAETMVPVEMETNETILNFVWI